MTPPAMAPTADAVTAAREEGAVVPFDQASRRAADQPLSFTITPGVAPVTIGPSDLTPNGFLRAVELHVSTVTAGTLGPGVAADGFPFNIFQNIQFKDTGGQAMDDLPGYALLQDNILSGWTLHPDPRSEWDYSANPISPNFRLRIERELFPDGVGALPNLSGSQKYRVRAVIDALSNIYSTAPTTPPTLKLDVIDKLWLLPNYIDGGGREQERRPPLLGLSQYRTSFYPAQSVTNPQVDIQIKATGNLIKYIVLVGRDNTGARNDAVFPDPFTLRVDNSYLYDSIPLSQVISDGQRMVAQGSGSGGGGRDTGVILIPYNYGHGKYAGDAGSNSWLPTSTATWIELKGRQAVTTNGTIDILVCEISLAEIDPNERPAMGSLTGTWNPAIPQRQPGGV